MTDYSGTVIVMDLPILMMGMASCLLGKVQAQMAIGPKKCPIAECPLLRGWNCRFLINVERCLDLLSRVPVYCIIH